MPKHYIRNVERFEFAFVPIRKYGFDVKLGSSNTARKNHFRKLKTLYLLLLKYHICTDGQFIYRNQS